MKFARMRHHFSFGNVLQFLFQVLIGLVLAGAIYRYCWMDIADPFKCSALLTQGEWLHTSADSNDSQAFQKWQPPGCIMHTYNKKDIEECFNQRKLVLIGDSTVRQIFWAIADKMGHNSTQKADSFGEGQKHKDLQFKSAGATIQFVWDPWLNSTVLEQEVYAFSPIASTAAKPNHSSAMVFVGAPGLWYARYGQDNYMKDYKEGIDNVIRYMDHVLDFKNSSSRNPARYQQAPPNLLLLAPVQVPDYASLSPPRQVTVTPAKIDSMNNYLQQTSAYSHADLVWSYSLMTWKIKNVYKDGGIHVVDSVAHRKADVLLNLRCNAESASRGYPYEGTCCMNYTPPGSTQWLMMFAALLVLPALCGLQKIRVVRTKLYLPRLEVCKALGTLLLILCFCYLADRTQLFEKAQKHFHMNQYILSLILLAGVGLLSMRMIKNSASATKNPVDHGFLSRHQTEEWKGWMQAVILIYHYTGASESLLVYEVIRVLVSSYLFMTAYGHALFSLNDRDFSLKRFATVLIRQNLLSIALSYMMGTDYFFYYFPALASFWFLVVYFVLKLGHKGNSNLYFVILKIVCSSMLTTTIMKTPGILEYICFFLRITCRISWNVGELRFRLCLDQYIVYIGMMAALIRHRCGQLARIQRPETHFDQICQIIMSAWNQHRRAIVLLAGVLIFTFWAWASQFASKKSYNQWLPISSSIPILCFIVLRNSCRTFRNYHSTIFAWLGRISLEMYVLQYHIWLAGDTKGILRIGLFSHGVEFVILTTLFIWLSRCTAESIRMLTHWIVGPEDLVNGGRLGLPEQDLPMSVVSKANVSRSFSNEHSINKDMTSSATFRHWLIVYERKLREDLRWRLVTLLLGLWLANLTYR